jgi:osmotically-inducible protein OsmY
MRRFLVLSLALFTITACGGTVSRHTGADVEQISRDVDAVVSQTIRRTVFGDKSMSDDARNIYVQTHNGIVTLRGIVKSEVERERLLLLARAVSGVREIKDEVRVSAAPVDMPPVADAYRTH